MSTEHAFVIGPTERPILPVLGTVDRFPVHRVYCIGQNYAEHTREMGGNPERDPPVFFCKPADALATGQQVPYPGMTRELHHEVELVVALSAGGADIPFEKAASCVYGYAVGVDLTRRDLQADAKKRGMPWEAAKAFDHSAPISAIVPAAVCGHPTAGRIALSVDGELRQSGDLADLIWTVPEIIVALSRYNRLRPGDLIFTGTPAGVGALYPGNRVTCSVEGVAELEFRIEPC